MGKMVSASQERIATGNICGVMVFEFHQNGYCTMSSYIGDTNRLVVVGALSSKMAAVNMEILNGANYYDLPEP